MSVWLRQSTSTDIGVGPFLDETDGKTAETGLTITQPDIRLKKNNGNWAQKNAAQTLTHEEAGWYELTLDATDTDTLGRLIVAIHESGALPVWKEFMVVPANVWDSMFGSDKLQVHADEITNGLITAAAIATGAIDADAIADGAIDAGAIADGAIDAGAIADNAITAAKINAGAITNTTFAAGAIDAAAVAADAFGAAELAAGAASEIGTAVWATTGRTLSDGAIVAATFGAGAIDAAAIATGAIDADAIADNAIDAGAIASGAITAAKFAAGAIDASAVAANAFGASELAADAIAEIQNGLSTLTAADVRDAIGLAAADLDDQLAALPTAAEINAEVVDALSVDTHAELTAIPGDTPTILQMLQLAFEAVKHRLSTTATVQSLYKANSTDVLAERDVSDDLTTTERGKMAAP